MMEETIFIPHSFTTWRSGFQCPLLQPTLAGASTMASVYMLLGDGGKKTERGVIRGPAVCRWFRLFNMPFGAMKSPVHDHFTELQRKIQLLGKFFYVLLEWF